MREALNSIVNLLTYMALGVMLILFGISMYNIATPYEVMIFFGSFFGLLLLAVVVGYTGNRAFPNFEMERYRVFFFCVETLGIILLSLVGIGLRLEAINYTGIIYDKWGLYDNASIILTSDTFGIPEEIMATFIFKPAFFCYSLIGALSIYIKDVGANTMLYLQLVLHYLFAFFSYRVARKVSGRLAGIITFFILMCMPSLVASVGVLNENLFGIAVLFAQIWIFYSLQKRRHTELRILLKVIYYTLDGLLLGIAVFALPEASIVFVGEMIYILLLNRHTTRHVVSGLTLLISTLGGFFTLMCIKCVYLGVKFNLGLHGFLSYFTNGGTDGITGNLRFMSDNLAIAFSVDSFADKVLLHSLPMENETFYGNMILLSVCCLIFLWMSGEKVYFVLNLYFLLFFAYGAVFTHENIFHINIMPYLAILTGVLFEKIYVSFKVEPKRISKMIKQLSEITINKGLAEVIDLNENSELIEDDNKIDTVSSDNTVKEDDNTVKEDDIIENIDGNDEVPTVEKLLGVDKAKENEPESQKSEDDITKPLENPLPVPKRNDKENLDYDIDIKEDDDFDV